MTLDSLCLLKASVRESAKVTQWWKENSAGEERWNIVAVNMAMDVKPTCFSQWSKMGGCAQEVD